MSRNLYTRQRFRRAVRAFLLGRMAQGVASFLLILWLVRLLEPSDYGAYMVLWGLVEWLQPIGSLGLLEAARRFLPDLATRGSAEYVRAFVRWTTRARLTLLMALAGVLFISWDSLSQWLGFDAPQASQGWVVVVLLITVLSFRYACEMLEGLLEQRWSQLAHALMPIGRLAGVAILVSADSLSLAHVLWVDAGVSLACLLLAEYFLAKRLARLDAKGTYEASVREVATFAWHMAGVNVLQATANAGALRVIVARALGLEAAGLFAFLQHITLMVSRYMPAQLFANIIRPMLIARQASGAAELVPRALALMWKSNVLIVLSGVAVLAATSNVLVGTLSGGRFVDAGPVLLIMFIAMGATSQNQLVNMAMQIHDQTRALRIQSLLFLPVPIAALVGAIFGLTGAVTGILAAQWLRNVFALWWMRRHGVPVKLDWMGASRFAAAAGVAALLGAWAGVGFGPWVALAVTLVLLVPGAFLASPLGADEAELALRLDPRLGSLLKYFSAPQSS